MSTWIRIETFEADKNFDIRFAVSGSDGIESARKELVLWHAQVN